MKENIYHNSNFSSTINIYISNLSGNIQHSLAGKGSLGRLNFICLSEADSKLIYSAKTLNYC